MKIRRRGVGKNAGEEVAARLILLLLPTLIILVTSQIAEGSAETLEAAARRHIRALSYPEDSEMGLFFALAVPLDDPVSTKSMSVAFFFEANYKLANDPAEEKHSGETKSRRKRSTIDRKMIYDLLESKFEELGFDGRQCLLRSICETAREGDRLHAGHNGLVGDLMRITFAPSSSSDEVDPEYSQAEKMNQPEPDYCADVYELCPFSIYQYITEHS